MMRPLAILMLDVLTSVALVCAGTAAYEALGWPAWWIPISLVPWLVHLWLRMPLSNRQFVAGLGFFAFLIPLSVAVGDLGAR